MEDFDRPVIAGVVFDLSQARHGDMRIIDSVKNALVVFLGELGISGRIYVSHPDWQEMPKTMGEGTYYVSSYIEPQRFNVDKAFKDAVTVIGTQQMGESKNVFLFTNRFLAPNNYRYRKGFLVNEIRDYGCDITVFGIGDEYDRITLKSIVEESGGKFIHLDDPAQLSNELRRFSGR